jgi:hypothetical protein
MNRLCRVIGFEEEELRDDRCGEGVVNFAVETDNALLGIGEYDFLVTRGLLDCVLPSSIGKRYRLPCAIRVRKPCLLRGIYIFHRHIQLRNVQVCQPPPYSE